MNRREIPVAEVPDIPYDPWSEREVDDELWDLFEEVLDPREVFVLNALLFERLSLRAVAALLSMSKTHVARMRDEALAKLRAELILQRGI